MKLIVDRQLERRARILEGARELLSKRPYHEITVRELAKHCRVSVPTLYNQFGGKDALFAAAVESHFREALEGLVSDETPPGAARVLTLVSRLAERTIELGNYHQALLRAFAEARETQPVQRSIAADLQRAFGDELVAMQGLGQLVDWVDPASLAVHLTLGCIGGTMVWAQGGVSDGGLAPFMRNGAAVLLLGVARGKARSELEEAAKRSQPRLG